MRGLALLVALAGLAALVVAPGAGAHEVLSPEELPDAPEASSSWWFSAIANGVMSVTFFAIAAYMWKAIYDGGQLMQNPLLTGMALIFTTCAIGHGLHFEHTMLPIYAPALGLWDASAAATFGAWTRVSMADPVLLSVDVVTAGLGLWYFTTRRRHAELFEGAELAEDIEQREREAREMHDSIVQSTSEALLLLQMDREEEAQEAIEASLEEAKGIVDGFLEEGRAVEIGPGDLRQEPPDHGPAAG